MASIYVQTGDIALPLAVSTDEVADGITLDYDHRGDVVGIEILGAKAVAVNGVRLGLPNED